MNKIKTVPEVIFKSHTHDMNVCGNDPFSWVDISTSDIFKNRKIVIFSIPGAFTPTCSSEHLPGFEKRIQDFKDLGIDEVICISVNDAFVMHQWALDQKVSGVTLLSDGSGEFTKGMDMLVAKDNLGFGQRSWRYSAYVDNMEIVKMFVEPGKVDNCPEDPFEVSDAETLLSYLKNL